MSANNVCVWDAFGDFTCGKPAATTNAFTTGGAGREFFTSDVGPKSGGALKAVEGFADFSMSGLASAMPGLFGGGKKSKENFCGCSAVNS
jgi:hypothetical protein